MSRKENGVSRSKNGYLEEKRGYLEEKIGYLDEKLGYLDEKLGYLGEKFGYLDDDIRCLGEKSYFGATVDISSKFALLFNVNANQTSQRNCNFPTEPLQSH